METEEFFTLDAKPILVRATFHVATTTQEEQRLIHKEMQSRILGLPEVSSVKTRIGVAPRGAVQLSHYYSAELLLEITLHEQWHLKESKKALSSKVIKLIQYPGIKAILVKVIEPLIPELSANTAKELRFKVNQESVRKFNLDELFAKEEIQSLIKHAPASARP